MEALNSGGLTCDTCGGSFCELIDAANARDFAIHEVTANLPERPTSVIDLSGVGAGTNETAATTREGSRNPFAGISGGLENFF